jgi:hypothetical protein
MNVLMSSLSKIKDLQNAGRFTLPNQASRVRSEDVTEIAANTVSTYNAVT